MGDGAPGRSGYDAPEIDRAKCEHERLLGEQARLRLQELLDAPGTTIADSGKRDRYGRALVWVRLRDGTTAGARLIEEGYARPWKRGYRSTWCE